ncbi:MAG: hypothetical protein IPN17_06600 [Deltaproteobacteria bacterium]|nr:hypothetical protein [Deltaproteobacteria bacterium]
MVLVRDGAWDGDVEVFEADEVEATGGGLHMRFGDNRVSFEGGRYVIEVSLRHRPHRGVPGARAAVRECPRSPATSVSTRVHHQLAGVAAHGGERDPLT